MINTVDDLHQRLAIGSRRQSIKQVELRDALAEKITQHYPGFHVAKAVAPDTVQHTDSQVDNIASITGWNDEPAASLRA